MLRMMYSPLIEVAAPNSLRIAVVRFSCQMWVITTFTPGNCSPVLASLTTPRIFPVVPADAITA